MRGRMYSIMLLLLPPHDDQIYNKEEEEDILNVICAKISVAFMTIEE